MTDPRKANTPDEAASNGEGHIRWRSIMVHRERSIVHRTSTGVTELSHGALHHDPMVQCGRGGYLDL